jgi:hypothetical protein
MFFGFSPHLQHNQHSKDIIHLLDDTGPCIAQDRNLTVDILSFVLQMYCELIDLILSLYRGEATHSTDGTIVTLVR